MSERNHERLKLIHWQSEDGGEKQLLDVSVNLTWRELYFLASKNKMNKSHIFGGVVICFNAINHERIIAIEIP